MRSSLPGVKASTGSQRGNADGPQGLPADVGNVARTCLLARREIPLCQSVIYRDPVHSLLLLLHTRGQEDPP